MTQKVRRLIYIVDPKFQIKFSLLLCFVVFISIALFFHPLISGVLDNLAIKYPQVSTEVNALKDQSIKLLILWEIAFILITFVSCIIMTHRIAGPVYKLKRYLMNIRNGVIDGKLEFRAGDYLHDLADEVNLTVDSIQSRFQQDSVYISEATTYLKNLKVSIPDDKKVVVEEIIKKLKEIEESMTENFSEE